MQPFVVLVLAVSISMAGAAARAQATSSNAQLTVTPNRSGTLSSTPDSLWFHKVIVGKSKVLTATLKNTGGSSVTVSGMTVGSSVYTVSGVSVPFTLSAGKTKTVTVTFKPNTTSYWDSNVQFTSNASVSKFKIYLHGTGGKDSGSSVLTASPSSLSFGNVQVNSSQTKSETLTNAGGSNLTISQATMTGIGFSQSGLGVPTTLSAGQSVTFTVKFAPTTSGSVTGNLAVVSGSGTLNIPLSGTGTANGSLSVSPSTLAFGNVTVGTSKSSTATLTANGATVVLTAATLSTSEFKITGLSLPLTLTSGKSASFTITFTPKSSGNASATATFASNASNPTLTETLTGTGTTAPVHSVNLSWNPSNSVVVGYNIYRGSKSGGAYTKINTALNSGTAYTDSSVTAGQTYYYVTSAVDPEGAESGFSNEVKAVVPTP